jgi:hypothetical protein
MKKLAAPMKSFGNLILMTVICIVIFWVFMALRPVHAGDGDGPSLQQCRQFWAGVIAIRKRSSKSRSKDCLDRYSVNELQARAETNDERAWRKEMDECHAAGGTRETCEEHAPRPARFREDDSGEGMACYNDGTGCRPCKTERECAEGLGVRPKPARFRRWRMAWQCNDLRVTVTGQNANTINYDIGGTIWGGINLTQTFDLHEGYRLFLRGVPCVPLR